MKPCSFPGCTRPAKGRGLCDPHLRQLYRGSTLRPVTDHAPRSVVGVCSFPGCGRRRHAKGLCTRHRRQQLAGEELSPLTGKGAHGSHNGMARLDADRVRSIRDAYATGRWTQRELAAVQGVHRSTIGDVLRRGTWRHAEAGISDGYCDAPSWCASSGDSPSSGCVERGEGAKMSPHRLIQEHPVVRGRPWLVLLSCALCNRTRGRHALPVLLDLLSLWPGPEELASAGVEELRSVLRPLGLPRIRAERIRAMCAAIVAEGIHVLPHRHSSVAHIPGAGKYAQDAWDLFVLGRTDVRPKDIELSRWLDWRLSTPT